MSTATHPGSATSIRIAWTPPVEYLMRLADTALVHAQRLSEWCGHGPVLEEDIALTNTALDLIGQARALLTLAAALEGSGHDEDALAFLRDERDFRNATLAELPMRRSSAHSPPGDFADAVLRNLLLAAWLKAAWDRLAAPGGSSDATLAAIAAKAVKEARYHLEHWGGWVVRLGDGTAESSARMRAALDRAWPYVAELFDADAVDAACEAAGFAPGRTGLRAAWEAAVRPVLAEAGLEVPAETPFRSTGTKGVHSEHLGGLLAEMQVLQRTHPGGRW